MEVLKCEMCGGNEVIKEGDLYVCQMCGTKYSDEAAKKLIVEGPLDISGSTIKIDESEGLIKSAQAHIQGNRFEQATELVDKLIKMYPFLPNGWEYRIECITRNYTTPCSDVAALNECMSEIKKNAQPDEFDRIEKKYLDYLQRTSSSIAKERMEVASSKLSVIENDIANCNSTYSERISSVKNENKSLEAAFKKYNFGAVIVSLESLFISIGITILMIYIAFLMGLTGNGFIDAIFMCVCFIVTIIVVTSIMNAIHKKSYSDAESMSKQYSDNKAYIDRMSDEYKVRLQELEGRKAKIQHFLAYGEGKVCSEVIKERQMYKSETVDKAIADSWEYVLTHE